MTRRTSALRFAAWTTLATLLSSCVHASEPAADEALARKMSPSIVASTTVAWLESTGSALRDGASRLHSELRGRGSVPEWVHVRPRRSARPEPAAPAGRDAYLAVQEDRPDGTDMVTVRYALAERGAVRAYAGAGLNRAQYFAEGDENAPTVLAKRERHSTLGAAAELGAEMRVSERVQLAADVRWADFDAGAEVLRADYGPVGAAPVMLGMTLGYRFR